MGEAALRLPALPCRPSDKHEWILIYGAASASGIMLCQILKHCGYRPLGIASAESSRRVLEYGAVATVDYKAPDCADQIRSVVGRDPIRYAVDCICTPESAALCLGAIARTGGRLGCLNPYPEAWQTRRAVRVKETVWSDMLDMPVPDETWEGTRGQTRDYPYRESFLEAVGQVQSLVDAGRLRPLAHREMPGGWEGIVDGLARLQRRQVRCEKLVVRIPPVSTDEEMLPG
ncbi:hypothetical protein HIM_05219 [Hirsutella minnesotensis 3608]|uniref:Alcohol dehydrogenase-like C-terminal domain-containing protein n=1 Tax=Hirsutella minnesotensis 3608 TaxID=1043627 RepID=A0A0F7ZUQ9_9HYPO|nr:hypothetical protein HIM_05219 [Hirsutella minnesotensis 3608]